jgi:nitrogen fixation-related uncharacterized protein
MRLSGEEMVLLAVVAFSAAIVGLLVLFHGGA